MRLVWAALLSPLGLFPVLALYMVAIAIGASGVHAGGLAAGLGSGLLLAGFGLGFGLLGALVVLLPGALVLRALGAANLWTVAALGLAAGLGLGFWERDPLGFVLFGLAGLGVGAAFGLLAGPALRRPRKEWRVPVGASAGPGRRAGPTRPGQPRVQRLLLAVALGVAGFLARPADGQAEAGPGRADPASIAQLLRATGPHALPRFRYDEQSGRCLDAEGREGYNDASREELERTRQGECANFSSEQFNLTYLRLTRANLRGANLANVLWYLGSITDSDLTGANLEGTTGEMSYQGSRLREARLSGADLSWADLRDADLEGADLRNSRFNRHTRLPFDHDEARRRGMVFDPQP